MSYALSDFMVHVDESLDVDERMKLEDIVRGDGCVISAAFPQRTPHLMMVVYDSECTHAKDILDHVRDTGFQATWL
ncbi:hypothetical protein SCT_1078 [Sulfuricella sp. T08]|uniref:hypothetical protein n=1 Tax=Sulfuricella sp. T08 TaxID=1632857 RepID=UPI0006179DC2|nr:hypothetical protein [Sulfuricella sp. T08]GAO35687.1 hypothetical protein SCT_1078 [Sulfuricella sp. T08]